VIDNSDDYPNDPSKAFNNYAYGSLAFEDMWPLRGDYDFNDLVVGYAINQVANGNGQIVQVDMDLEVRAVGAAYTNGLAFAFENLTPSDVASVSGQHFSSGSGSATESGQTQAVICAFDDVYDFLIALRCILQYIEL
jgi:LruC domain-containing protein